MNDQGAEASGRWVIGRLELELALSGSPEMTAEVEAMLSTPISALMNDISPDTARVAITFFVKVARSAMIREKRAGLPTVKVRRGLRVPVDWNDHYARIYLYELDWFVAGVMQSAMMKDDAGGERRLWRSR